MANNNTNTPQNILQPSNEEQTAGNPVFAVESYDPDNPCIILILEHSNQPSYEEEVDENNPDNPFIIVEDRDGNPGSEIEPYNPEVLHIESDDESNYGDYSEENALENVLTVESLNYFKEVKNSLCEFSNDFKYFKRLVIDYLTSETLRFGPLMFRRWARWILRNHTEHINGLNTFLPPDCHITNSSAIEHPEELFVDFIKIVTKKYPTVYEGKIMEFLIIKSNYAAGIADKKESLEKLADLFLHHEELLLEFSEYVSKKF